MPQEPNTTPEEQRGWHDQPYSYNLVFGWCCVEPGVVLDGLCGSLPTQDIQWFCHPMILRGTAPLPRCTADVPQMCPAPLCRAAPEQQLGRTRLLPRFPRWQRGARERMGAAAALAPSGLLRALSATLFLPLKLRVYAQGEAVVSASHRSGRALGKARSEPPPRPRRADRDRGIHASFPRTVPVTPAGEEAARAEHPTPAQDGCMLGGRRGTPACTYTAKVTNKERES